LKAYIHTQQSNGTLHVFLSIYNEGWLIGKWVRFINIFSSYLMRQTKQRLSNPTEDSQPQKKIHCKCGSHTPLPTVVLGHSDPSGAHTSGNSSLPVCARIFRDGKCYIPPSLLQPAMAPLPDPATLPGPSVKRTFQPGRIVALDWPHAAQTPPLQRPSLEEAWHLNFPHTRLLTNIQAVNRRVRLLLPEDGSIVDPSANPHTRPASTSAISAVLEPDPSSWAGQYVCHLHCR
jgi:hypothetical protein